MMDDPYERGLPRGALHRDRGASSSTHDLPQVLGRFFAADARCPRIGVDTWSRRDSEPLGHASETTGRRGGEGPHSETAPVNRAETEPPGRRFQLRHCSAST